MYIFVPRGAPSGGGEATWDDQRAFTPRDKTNLPAKARREVKAVGRHRACKWLPSDRTAHPRDRVTPLALFGSELDRKLQFTVRCCPLNTVSTVIPIANEPENLFGFIRLSLFEEDHEHAARDTEHASYNKI